MDTDRDRPNHCPVLGGSSKVNSPSSPSSSGKLAAPLPPPSPLSLAILDELLLRDPTLPLDGLRLPARFDAGAVAVGGGGGMYTLL